MSLADQIEDAKHALEIQRIANAATGLTDYAALLAYVDALAAQLAEAERDTDTLFGMIRHQRDVLRECLPYLNESMAGRRPGRSADNIRAAVKALTADAALDCADRRALLAYVDALREAAGRAERKLTAYVGVCAGDKELTEAVLPMLRAMLQERQP